MTVTQEMIEAGQTALSDHTDKYMDGSEVVQGGAVEAIYVAMSALAPTAPVEASGSERGQAGAVMDALWPLLGGNHTSAELGTEIDAAVSEALRPQPSGFIATLTDDQRAAALAHTGDDTHPQPSGETREALGDLIASNLLRLACRHKRDAKTFAEDGLDFADAILALLSARPPALGGQQGSGEESQ